MHRNVLCCQWTPFFYSSFHSCTFMRCIFALLIKFACSFYDFFNGVINYVTFFRALFFWCAAQQKWMTTQLNISIQPREEKKKEFTHRNTHQNKNGWVKLIEINFRQIYKKKRERITILNWKFCRLNPHNIWFV